MQKTCISYSCLSLVAPSGSYVCMIIRFINCFGKKGTNFSRNGIFAFYSTLANQKVVNESLQFSQCVCLIWPIKNRSAMLRNYRPSLFANHVRTIVIGIKLLKKSNEKWSVFIECQLCDAHQCNGNEIILTLNFQSENLSFYFFFLMCASKLTKISLQVFVIPHPVHPSMSYDLV